MTSRNSQQFNFSLHVINHIKFKDKFLMKTNENLKIFCQKTATEFANKQRKKEHWTTFCEGLEWSVQKNVLQ